MQFWTDPWFVSGVTGVVAGITYVGGIKLFPGGIAGMWAWMLIAMIVSGIAGMFLDHMVGMVEAAVSGMVVPMAVMAAPDRHRMWSLLIAVASTATVMELIHRLQSKAGHKGSG